MENNIFTRIWSLYRDGFRNMTWGRPLWFLIILKVVILFGILRLFFFRPVMSGMSEEQKSETVGERLSSFQEDLEEGTVIIGEDDI
ncbi:MAG: DUF4492 domain-containing protein [Bacteroidales bacterium]|nr:DUF4492 domain-containing protein [Bacteroidales bacterium]